MTNFPKPRFIETNGIKIAVYEKGEGFPVIFAHGFPELAYSWRYQMEAVANAGFKAIALDMRGYGKTDKPKEMEKYDVACITGDLAGACKALGYDKAIFCGHDWGGHMVWEMYALHPEVVAGIIVLSSPRMFFRRMGTDAIGWMKKYISPNYYKVVYHDTPMEDLLTAFSPEFLPTYLSAIYRARPVTMEECMSTPIHKLEPDYINEHVLFVDPPRGTAFMTPEEIQVYVDSFLEGGMDGPLNWYKCISRSMKIIDGTSPNVDVPCLMLPAEDDMFLQPHLSEGTEIYVKDLETHIIPESGHWVQQEKPEEVNFWITDWLKRRFA